MEIEGEEARMRQVSIAQERKSRREALEKLFENIAEKNTIINSLQSELFEL